MKHVHCYTRARNANCGHYYCQIGKEGQLCNGTNWRKFEDFQVNPRWIGGWLQSGKLSPATAEAELLSCRLGSFNLLKELRALEDAWSSHLGTRPANVHG